VGVPEFATVPEVDVDVDVARHIDFEGVCVL
jgi:hypothetical protein